MNTNKNIIIFFLIALVCLAVSAIGIYLINKEVGLLYLGISLATIPLLTIASIIINQMKSK